MITTSQFQERLIEYLDGELSDTERMEVEEYLRAHPEAAELKGDLALLSEAGRSIRESSYPADLLLDANRALAARLSVPSGDADSRRPAPDPVGNGSPQTPGPTPAPRSRRRWRPRTVAAALAAGAILLAGAASQRAAIAEVASSLLERIWVSTDGEQWHGLVKAKETADGAVFYVSEIHPLEPGDAIRLEPGDTIRVFFPEMGDTIRFPVPEKGDTVRVFSGPFPAGPFPAGKTGAKSPGIPAQSWGEVKESVDPEVETSP